MKAKALGILALAVVGSVSAQQSNSTSTPLLNTFVQSILDNYVSYKTKNVDLFSDPYYLLNLGIPLKNYLNRNPIVTWTKDDFKDIVQLYVDYKKAIADFIDRTEYFSRDIFDTGITNSTDQLTGVAQTLDFDEIWNNDYDDDTFDLITTVQDICTKGTVAAEVYAFYDVMFGRTGTIKAYYDAYGMGEDPDTKMEVPDGFAEFVQYMYSTDDQVWGVGVIQKHHLFVTDLAVDYMADLCNNTDVQKLDAELLFDIVRRYVQEDALTGN